jgi:FkbM family methyltransferase
MANINMKQFVQLTKDRFTDEDIKVIVEVGSLDGKDSEYFKMQFPHATVIAFEGLKENWESASPSGIKWCNTVIASYDGETTYHVKHFNKEMSTGIHGIYDRGAMYGTEKRTVKCYRLDSMFYSEERIDMMKIDVEGATWDVLEGMGDLLDAVKIMHIETETIPYFIGQKMLHDEVCSYLTDRNFKCIKQAGANIGGGTQYDTVWVNEKYLDS